MLLILLGLVVLLLVLTVLFFTFADGDLTLMLFEHYGSKAGKYFAFHCILHVHFWYNYYEEQQLRALLVCGNVTILPQKILFIDHLM